MSNSSTETRTPFKELLDITASDDGKKTIVTFSMTPAVAQRLLEAFADGSLAALGITDVSLVSNPPSSQSKKLWAADETAKRAKSKDGKSQPD